MKGIRLRAAWSRALDVLPGGLLALALLAGPLAAHGAELAGQDLTEMDLEELMEIEVTSVSKRAQKLSHAPAAITVITEEDIRRSGVLTLPELLRGVPGLHVAQIDATHWSVSSRGFADEFSNKLLVLIDGRTIYEPIFSGVLWNQHDLMLEDIARIEVVRGPGGALWGANAVNGVINITTKAAKDTQGLLLSTQAGSYEKWNGAARYGFAVGDDVHARFYGKFADRRDFEDPSTGADADDNWQSIRAGGRIEWDVTDATLLTLQGDWFDTQADRVITGGLPDEELNDGGNVLFRAAHTFSPTQSLSFQAYYDRTDRDWLLIAEERDTYDAELQHSFAPFARNQVVWGGGYRRNRSATEGSVALGFAPTHRKDDLWNLFVQDEITLVEDLLTVSLGSKFEKNDYTAGWEVQPSGRVLVTPTERYSLWAAVSRAVRTPSRLEEDVFFIQPTGPLDFLVVTGSSRVASEDLLAYEAGLKARPIDPLTFDLAAYYNDYDDLRTTEIFAVIPNSPFPGATTTLASFDNQMEGASYGVELAGT
jgi:iron complex outermembrane recepter protein